MNRRERKAIIAVLKNGEVEPCLEAITVIQAHGGKATNRLLLWGMRSRHLAVRAAAIRALAKPTNFTVLGRLFFHIKHDGLAIQQEAVDALGRLGSPYSIARLIQILSDPTSQVRMHAARALGHIGDQRAIPALIEALHDENRTVVDWAAEALASFHRAALDPLLEVLTIADLAESPEGLAMKKRAAERFNRPELLQIDTRYDRNARTRAAAAAALAQMGDLALPSVVELLKDSRPDVQRYGVETIAAMGTPSTIPILQGLLTHPDANCREQAVVGLGRIADPTVLPILRGVISDPAYRVRECLVYAFSRRAKQGESDALDGLLEMLNDTNADVRSQVIEHLAEIADPRVLPALAAYLNDEQEGDHYQRTVSETTLYALERLDSDEARAIVANWRNNRSSMPN